MPCYVLACHVSYCTPPSACCRPYAPKECQRQVEPPELLMTACSRHCKNGHCTPTGKCCCSPGWEGPFCRIGGCLTSPVHLFTCTGAVAACLRVHWSLFGCVFPPLPQPNVSQPAAMEGCVWSPTSACARVAILGPSVRRVRGVCPTTRRKTAYWTTSST